MSLFLKFFGCLFMSINQSTVIQLENADKYTAKHNEARSFVKENHFNQNYYFLLDFSIHSGKNRFFIYDFSKKEVTQSALVTHGSCDMLEPNPTAYEKAKFSNKLDSHCSSRGKYKIGTRDYSTWGIHVKYWLHGLEPSNSKALERIVVLHSWSIVEDYEVFPDYSPLSWGCPAVSNSFMKVLDELLKKSNKPVLLWIVD